MRSLLCVLRAALLGLVAVAVAAPAAQAILIRNTSDPGYVTGNTAFTGVVNISFNFLSQTGTFRCSGALLADGLHVVTAGHCLDGASNWQITFETPSGPTTLGIAAGGANIHPLFAARPFPLDNIDQYDIGVLKLASLAPADAERYGIQEDLPDPLTTTMLDLVGYGIGGSPASGPLASGTRRHATNTIDAVVTTFTDITPNVPAPDKPLRMSVLFSTAAVGEGLIAQGDSGSPALLGNNIVGIGSTTTYQGGGSAIPSTTTLRSTHANLAEDSIGNWVKSFVQSVPVVIGLPEPETAILFALAALFVLRRARHAA